MRRTKGVSVLELLVTLAILGVVLAALSAFFSANLRLSDEQTDLADANLAVRLSLLRMSEIVSQAHYIYPAAQTITLEGKTFTTGPDTLAILVPVGTAFCDPTSTDSTYCGMLFTIEDRSTYAGFLGANAASNFVLTEWRALNRLTWDQSTVPAQSLTNWGAAELPAGVLADSVLPASAANGSSLAAAADLTIARETPLYDDESKFLYSNADRTSAQGLVQSVNVRLVVRSNARNQGDVSRSSFAYARSIPRGAQPNPD